MKIQIEILPKLYDEMVIRLGTMTIGDMMKDPLAIVCSHIREAVEYANPEMPAGVYIHLQKSESEFPSEPRKNG